LRRILDAILYVLRTGCPWRYLPINFSPWQTVFYHFRRFSSKNSLHLINMALHRAERERAGHHLDPSAAVMNGQSVKTVEESGGIRGYDGGKLVKSRKRHPLVDTLGLPSAWYVTAADLSDLQGARKLLAGLAYFVLRLKTTWADAAYLARS
jgi:putative transposase